MSAAENPLKPLLEAELNTLQTLAACLKSEHTALLSNEVADLEQATRNKQDAISAHQTQQTQRIQWMAARGIPSTTGLKELLSLCKAGNDVDALRNRLSTLADECQSLNRSNGGLILRLHERTRGALDVLRGDTENSDVYSLSGAKQHQSESRTLGKA